MSDSAITRVVLTNADRRALADLRVMATARAVWRATRRAGGHAVATALFAELVRMLAGSEWVANATIARVRELDTVRVDLTCGHRYTRYLDGGKLDASPDLIKSGDPVFCPTCPFSRAPVTVTRVRVNGHEWRHDRVSLRCGHVTWRARRADSAPVASVGGTLRCPDGACMGQPRTVSQVWTSEPAAPAA